MQPTVAASSKPRVAWFSSLPGGITPVGSKSAYASQKLLHLLRPHFELELFHDEFRHYEDFPTHHYLSAFERHAAAPFDLFFYQLEDLPCAAFARAHLGLVPGVVWFHDLLFTTQCPEGLLHSPWEVALQKFLGQTIPWPQQELWPDVSVPLDKRAASLALLPVFSNPWEHSEYLRCITQSLCDGLSPRPHSFYLPLPADLPPKSIRPEGPLVVGFPGSPRIESRAHILLQSLAEIAGPTKLVWLLDETELSQGKELCKEFGISAVEFVVGRSAANWEAIIPRINIGVHTLFSVFGGTSPFLSLTLLAKLPAITMRFGASELLPPAATIQIEPGDSEVGQLRKALEQQLLAQTDNEVGYRYAHETFLTPHIVAELTTLLRSAVAPLRDGLTKWAALEKDARHHLLTKIHSNRSHRAGGAIALDPLKAAFEELGWVA